MTADSARCSMGRAHTVVVAEAVAGRELRVCGVHAISPGLHDLLLLLRDWASAGRREERASDGEAHQKPGRDGSADGAAIIRRPGSDEMHDARSTAAAEGEKGFRERAGGLVVYFSMMMQGKSGVAACRGLGRFLVNLQLKAPQHWWHTPGTNGGACHTSKFGTRSRAGNGPAQLQTRSFRSFFRSIRVMIIAGGTGASRSRVPATVAAATREVVLREHYTRGAQPPSSKPKAGTS
jgi:hypothetical protein